MRRQRAMSSEKRAESCFKVPQSSLLKAQSSLLKAQSRNEKIRVNSRDTRKLICVFCDFARYFRIFVA